LSRLATAPLSHCPAELLSRLAIVALHDRACRRPAALALEAAEAAPGEAQLVAVAERLVGERVEDTVDGGRGVRQEDAHRVRLTHGPVTLVHEAEEGVGGPAQAEHEEDEEQCLRQPHLRDKVRARVFLLPTSRTEGKGCIET
jgi:hypothetical protein